ncbi:invasin domain 3-containing protein, partial [Balneolaceae bacterium ANBcel3]|nr:invasin domain 3-containing protein [Balneolaceae bacterium ANBcel3]
IPPWHAGDGTPNILPAQSDTEGISVGIHDSSWGFYDQSNDYSFDPNATSFILNPNITAYYEGQLVWGNEPIAMADIDPQASGLSASPTELPAGELTTLTVTLIDPDGQPVTGAPLSVFSFGFSGDGYILPGSFTESSAGVYTVDMTSDRVETVVAELVVFGTLLDQTAVVTFEDFRSSNYYPAGLSSEHLQAWFDAMDAEMLFQDMNRTVPAQDGSPVLFWRDKAPGPTNASQSDSFISPFFRTSAAFGGRPSLEFEDSQYLVFDGSFMAGTNYSISAAVARGSDREFNPYIGGNSYDTNNNLHVFWSDNTTFNHHHYNNDYDVTVPGWSPSSLDGEIHFLRFSADEGTPGRELWRNGELLGQGGSSEPLNSWQGAAMGRYIDGSQPHIYTQWFDGYIGELIFHDKALSVSERILMENYLAVRWGRDLPEAVTKITPPGAYIHELVGIGREQSADAVTSTSYTSGGMGFESGTGSGAFLSTDGNYLVAVHDGAEGMSAQPVTVEGDVYTHLERVWYVEKTEVSPGGGIVTLYIDLDESDLEEAEPGEEYRILYRAEEGSFEDGGTAVDTEAEIEGQLVRFTLHSDELQNGFYTVGKRWPSLVFYSRQSGNLQDSETWSVTGHDGDPFGLAPLGDAEIRIGGSDFEGHVITLQEDIALDDSGSLIVWDTGEGAGVLNVGAFVVSGSGTFELQAGGTLVIGSEDGIAETDDAGSIQTSQRIFSSDASYVYQGSASQAAGDGLPDEVLNLGISNPNGVMLNQSVQVNGTLNLEEGELILSSGSNLIAPQKNYINGSLRFLRELTGHKGWRLMTSPVETSFEDFLTGPDPSRRIISQGFEGADHPDQMPNVLYFEEGAPGDTVTTNQKWRTPSSLTESLQPGRGYFVYVFDGADGPGTSIPSRPDVLPFEISAGGLENEPQVEGSSFTFDVSHTARHIHTEDEGWNLVGNPFGASINWDDTDHWTREDMHQSFYIWDPSANEGHGEYRYWNGLVGNNGSLQGGNIAPFQAFWVKTESDQAVLSVHPGAKTTEGVFIGKQQNNRPLADQQSRESLFDQLKIRTEHHASGLGSEARVLFSHDGRMDPDPLDVYRLTPLGSTYISAFFIREDDKPLSVHSLPYHMNQSFDLPLYTYGAMNGIPLSGRTRLTWSFPESLPEEVAIRLIDKENGQEINMREESSYEFELCSRTAYKQKAQTLAHKRVLDEAARADEVLFKINQPGSPVVLNMPFDGNDSRFRVAICMARKAIPGELPPDHFALFQNYPNPFNPSTHIRFAVPEESHVRLAVFDVLGRQVALLADDRYMKGHHEVQWDAGLLPSGVYLYRMEADGQVFTRKMLLVK